MQEASPFNHCSGFGRADVGDGGTLTAESAKGASLSTAVALGFANNPASVSTFANSSDAETEIPIEAPLGA